MSITISWCAGQVCSAGSCCCCLWVGQAAGIRNKYLTNANFRQTKPQLIRRSLLSIGSLSQLQLESTLPVAVAVAAASWQLAAQFQCEPMQSKRIHIRNIGDDLKINIGAAQPRTDCPMSAVHCPQSAVHSPFSTAHRPLPRPVNQFICWPVGNAVNFSTAWPTDWRYTSLSSLNQFTVAICASWMSDPLSGHLSLYLSVCLSVVLGCLFGFAGNKPLSRNFYVRLRKTTK